jgi:hypothetical protein
MRDVDPNRWVAEKSATGCGSALLRPAQAGIGRFSDKARLMQLQQSSANKAKVIN